MAKLGARNWSLIAKAIPGRSGKSCRLRWVPSIRATTEATTGGGEPGKGPLACSIIAIRWYRGHMQLHRQHGGSMACMECPACKQCAVLSAACIALLVPPRRAGWPLLGLSLLDA